MELYKINVDNDTISDYDCSNFSDLQLLNIKNTCTFSKIAKFFISQNGFNEDNIYIVISYNCDFRAKFRNKNFIDNNSNNLKYVMKNTILLNNGDLVSLYSSEQKQSLLFYAKKGDCIFINDKSDISFHKGGTKTLTFYYFKERPNLNLCYTSETTKERKVSISFLKPNEFITLLNPLKIINNTFILKDAKEYIDKYQQDDANIRNNINKKFIVSVVNSFTTPTNIDKISIDKDEDLNDFDLIDYDSTYKNKIPDHYNLLLKYNSKEKEQLKSSLIEIQKYSNNYFNTLSTEQPQILFINKVNLSENEKLLTNITSELLEKYMNINYNPYCYDIAINGIAPYLGKPIIGESIICNFIITLENASMDEYIVLKNHHPTLQSNHIYHINPIEFNIISFHLNHAFKNTINRSKYIEIRVYHTIDPNQFRHTFQYMKKPFYINNNNSITNENICPEIKYTVNEYECITIFDKNIFNVEDIRKLYKNSIEKNKNIHFLYNQGITILDRVNNENENLFKISSYNINEFYNKRLLNIKENICNGSITIINNQNYYFYEFIFLFQNLVSKTINELYGDHYSLNIVKCIVIGNKYDSNEENMALSYKEKYYCNKHGLIIYADINIKDENNIINLYTNYSQYDYDKKYTIRYIIEALNTENDIININEQEKLLEYINNEYTLLKNERYKSILTYGPPNKSWDLPIYNIPDTETYIKNLIENIRQRIIEKENIVFTNEPSKLPSFIQILEENAATHFHTDMQDTDNYHIRFNVIIQNAVEGGIPIYNGIMKPCQERQYILCRSGLDTHCSSIVKGDKPRIIISFGFNIPIKDIHKHPNIFYDLIQNQ